MPKVASRAAIAWELSRIRFAMQTLMQRRDEARAIQGEGTASVDYEKRDQLFDALTPRQLDHVVDAPTERLACDLGRTRKAFAHIDAAVDDALVAAGVIVKKDGAA